MYPFIFFYILQRNEEDTGHNPSLSFFNLSCKSPAVPLTLETAQSNVIDNPTNKSLSSSSSPLENTQNTNGLSNRVLQALVHKRGEFFFLNSSYVNNLVLLEKFLKGVCDIFQHVNEDFINLDKITIIYLDMLKKYERLL
jgi:hypothetical protein